MKEAATMLSEEAQQAASILHQTPGWRWRRKCCLTERTQQCQSGPTTEAWFHVRCNRVDSDACRESNVTTRVRNSVKALARSSAKGWRSACRRGNVGRVRTCGEHCQSCMERVAGAGGTAGRARVAPPEQDPRGSGQHCFKELSRQRSCNAKRHAGSTVWGRADGTARQHRLDECG